MTHELNAPGRRTPHAPELRWRLLDDLATAREDWGLKDRTIAVLRALLGFLPKDETMRLTVFPSNRTLGERLMGMPESTLRRHLARLVAAGLIRRRPSPNGKRYRIGADLAYGFDLAPFFASAVEIRERAIAARQVRERLRALRARIRTVLAQITVAAERSAELLRLLRRKVAPQRLETVLHDLEAELPPEKDVAAAQIGCDSDSKTESDQTVGQERIARAAIAEVAEMVDLPVASIPELREAGERAAHALSVHSAWTHARQRHGLVWAVVALAFLKPRIVRLRHPDRYLRALTRRAGAGGFDLMASLHRSAMRPA